MDDFKEKMDAMRMNLELAIHEIETTGGKIEELRIASANQYESIQALMKISGGLVRTAEIHERRITSVEGRI